MTEVIVGTDVVRSDAWKALRAEEGLAGWSDEDISWLEGLNPPIIIPIAKRYGRACMTFVIKGGVIGHGFERLFASRPPKPMLATLQIMSLHINSLMEDALKGAGVSAEHFTSCQEDLDRLAKLQDDGQGGKKSAGGIILAS
mgnify:CR=1 FL=1